MGIAKFLMNISSTRNHLFLQSALNRAWILLVIVGHPLPISSTRNHPFLLYGQNDMGYCWPPCDNSTHQESSLSSPGHFEQGQDNVEYGLSSLFIPLNRNHILMVYGTIMMLVIASLLLFHPSGFHSFPYSISLTRSLVCWVLLASL